jgi:hypothetical protein
VTGCPTPPAPATGRPTAALRHRHGSACVQHSRGTAPAEEVRGVSSYATLPGLSYDGADATPTGKGEPREICALDGSLHPPPVDIEVALPCFFLVGHR